MKIAVCIPTRARPELLGSCLESLARLSVPDGCAVQVIVVENDVSAQCREIVSGASELWSRFGEITYHHQPRLGIAIARNTCVRLSIDSGADFIAFIDDDETPEPDWLLKHISAQEFSHVHLRGGPVRLARPDRTRGLLDRMMQASLLNRYEAVERKARKVSTRSDSGATTIVTNNWFCSASVFAEHGVWFNEALGMAGGEDTEFYKDCKRRGLRTGWVEDAVVWDHLPVERLSPLYQFRRARDQSNSHFHLKRRLGELSRPATLISVVVKGISLVVFSPLVLIAPTHFLLRFLRTSGWIVGRVQGVLGKRSAHYASVTGS
ncbi:glycosyltransferase family 2 protein [Albidovulum sediminis]|uniref:Glycosyltransferase family 2 protein n=1 Tax=Albidovulum sediminis TaxID=3066345 RepID=A0ABT2NPV0_9RHOB|nr:glycosyltransferase family 2 protein [Defluviimonas sediminis]MCT8330962.1 glycosyltransferase family 2 protein [Defluviimonas sediminis]